MNKQPFLNFSAKLFQGSFTIKDRLAISPKETRKEVERERQKSEGKPNKRGRRREKEPPSEPNLPQILDLPSKLAHATAC
jgi:hypothetical protein